MLCSLVVLALLASVQGRAVNISNTWVLPEEGFPVFYRYFRDRISWYEADAVCQFHHANLVTGYRSLLQDWLKKRSKEGKVNPEEVDTTAQYDAVRAYLKELDISSAVWVGLIRSNPDGDFTWTDYRGLSSDGYWSSAPDSRSAPLCAATNPTADYRWEARACGGPTVASFICELPVPQWALGNEGCMVKALPALTILYLPESAAVQLTADCGLAGVKRVQCTGSVKREDLLKDLACVDDEEPTTVLPPSSTGSGWSATTDITFTDHEITTELTTQEPLTTEHEVDINQPNLITTTIRQEPLFTLTTNVNRNMLMNKNVDLSDNNAQSNFIPKNANEENILTDDQLEKLEDERHMQHKMLHEEIARVGNVENIFNQPTDHFIPPLVMAKAKISDDMTVLSLAEKHAQQLAEKQFSRRYEEIDRIHNHSGFNKVNSDLNSEKPLMASIKSDKLKDVKKDFKTNLPKKYLNDKYYDSKTKLSKVTEFKVVEKDRTTEVTSTDQHDNIKTTTSTSVPIIINRQNEDDMDLTVILKDVNLNSDEQTTFTNYTGDVVKLDSIVKTPNLSEPIILGNVNNSENNSTSDSKISEDVTMDHEVIKITIIDDDSTDNAKVFEVTTKVPIFKDQPDKIFSTSTFVPEIHIEPIHTTEAPFISEESTTLTTAEVKIQNITVPGVISTTVGTINPITEHTSTIHVSFTESTITTVEQITVKPTTNKVSEISTSKSTIENINNTTVSNTTTDQDSNYTEIHDDFDGNDSNGRNDTGSDEDFQSPLLSGANEPVHRPPRTRRPQQPNRNKFNPFRILG